VAQGGADAVVPVSRHLKRLRPYRSPKVLAVLMSGVQQALVFACRNSMAKWIP